jgi:hypothetical protein
LAVINRALTTLQLWVSAVPGQFDNLRYWLNLARDSRAAARQVSDECSRRTLLLIARRYEIMAERAKHRLDRGWSLKSA